METQQQSSCQTPVKPGGVDWHMLGRLAVIAAAAMPVLTMAQTTGASAEQSVCNLLGQVQNVLTGVSVVVVTIAIIFAGYQIAFAHKRITEVAPILIGGILIGAAGQIAATLLRGYTACAPQTTMIMPDITTRLASIAHSLAGYLT